MGAAEPVRGPDRKHDLSDYKQALRECGGRPGAKAISEKLSYEYTTALRHLKEYAREDGTGIEMEEPVAHRFVFHLEEGEQE